MFVFGVGLVVLGSLLIYLLSPHQKMLPCRLRHFGWLCLAAGALVPGFVLLMSEFSAVAGFFCGLTLVMLSFAALPYTGLLFSTSGGGNGRTN